LDGIARPRELLEKAVAIADDPGVEAAPAFDKKGRSVARTRSRTNVAQPLAGVDPLAGRFRFSGGVIRGCGAKFKADIASTGVRSTEERVPQSAALDPIHSHPIKGEWRAVIAGCFGGPAVIISA